MFPGIIILPLLLFFCCYLPIFLFFHGGEERPDGSLAVMLTGVGITVTGVLVVILKYMGLGFFSALFILAVTGCYTFWRYKLQCLPSLPRVSITSHTVLLTIFCVLYLLRVVIPGFLMGTGEYPALFFNVDSPYYLGQIHSLLQSDAWPPSSLSFSGGSVGYHYGAQAATAFFSRYTGWPPHTCAFLLYTPLISIGVVATVIRIGSMASSKGVGLLTILLLLYSAFYPLTELARIISDSLNGCFEPEKLYTLLADPQVFDNGYPMLSTRSGIFLALVICYCLEQYEKSGHLRLAVLCTGMIIIFKSPYFIPVGLGFGLWTLGKSLQLKKVNYLSAPALALAIGLALREISSPAQDFNLIFSPGVLFHSMRPFVDITGSLVLVLSIPVLILICRYGGNRSFFYYYLLFLIPPYIFVNIFALTRNGKVEVGNLLQLLSLSPLFAAACASASLRENWPTLSSLQKKAMALLTGLVVLAPFSHGVFQIYRQISTPRSWHEYVDNGPLAEVLAKIKHDDVLIVTNDFHYPAQNFRRDKRQMQIPAIFGQQAYAVNFIYEHYPESLKRLEEQQLFRSATWNPKLHVLAEQKGWTHLLIRLAAPHPEQIPYPLIGQNSEYQLFALLDLSGETSSK
ncbi:MAG: DUF2298 domain-containing protein [Desulfobulbaceae bacterium]|nr:DUF2298 domain-containing protein [Desulfobulbaceae bacterium]